MSPMKRTREVAEATDKVATPLDELRAPKRVRLEAESPKKKACGGWEVFFDGASKGNPGVAGAGWAVREDNKWIARGWKFVGASSTNNEAEYDAVLDALAFVASVGDRPARVSVLGDSKLVVEQVNGNWKIKAAHLVEKAEEVRRRMRALGIKKLTHVPREKNAEADRMSNVAVRKGGGVEWKWVN